MPGAELGSWQARVRRFLALTHSKHLKRARIRNFFHGVDLLLYALAMLLFLAATLHERADGVFSSAGHAVRQHLTPAPVLHPSSLQDHFLSPALLVHPHQFWAWLEHSYLPRYRALGAQPACDQGLSDARACTPSAHDSFPAHVVRQLVVTQKVCAP